MGAVLDEILNYMISQVNTTRFQRKRKKGGRGVKEKTSTDRD
jgi:hypothetical protein